MTALNPSTPWKAPNPADPMETRTPCEPPAASDPMQAHEPRTQPIEPPTTPQTHGGSLPHAARCKRPAPVLRLSWRGTPEIHCPSCGRYAPA